MWYWMAHSFRQISMKYKSVIQQYVSMGTLWTCYWKVSPFLISYWYAFQFTPSGNQHLSIGLLMLFFGRWSLSFNWPAKCSWPNKDRWQGETYNSMISLTFASMYHHGMELFQYTWS